MKFTTSHSGRPFLIYVIEIAYHKPDAETRLATVVVTEDEFLLEKVDKTIPSIAYKKLCQTIGINRGSIIVDTYLVRTIKTQYFIV